MYTYILKFSCNYSIKYTNLLLWEYILHIQYNYILLCVHGGGVVKTSRFDFTLEPFRHKHFAFLDPIDFYIGKCQN